MKKYNRFIVMLGTALLIAGCIECKPQCYVLEDVYFNDDTDKHVKELGDEYEYYGKVEKYVEACPKKEFTTNYKEYLDKEIYVNKEDHSDIYLKYGENDYLRLYNNETHDKEFENLVLQ